MRAAKIWKSILWETWRKTFADLHILMGWSLMVPFLLYGIYAVLIFTLVDVDTAKSELVSKLLLVAAPLALFPIYFLFSIPFVVAKREASLGERLVRLKTRLTPRFKIDWNKQEFGEPSHRANGPMQSFICLTVQNISENQSDICAASIVEMAGDNGKGIADPIELKWMGNGDHDQTWTQIPTGATRTAKAFLLSNGRPAINLPVLPSHLRGLFDGAAKFTGKIAFDDRYYGGQMVSFILDVESAELELIHSETFDVRWQKDIEEDTP